MSDERFEGPLSKIAVANADMKHLWLEDELVPVSQEEFDRSLRDTIAMAREKGWIPKEDPGCQCFVCRSWRDAGL